MLTRTSARLTPPRRAPPQAQHALAACAAQALGPRCRGVDALPASLPSAQARLSTLAPSEPPWRPTRPTACRMGSPPGKREPARETSPPWARHRPQAESQLPTTPLRAAYQQQSHRRRGPQRRQWWRRAPQRVWAAATRRWRRQGLCGLPLGAPRSSCPAGRLR